jgi:hypothetical protein
MKMRIIVQDRQSQLYLEGESNWTQDLCKAREFPVITDAITFVHRTKLNKMDVLMHFGDARFDFRAQVSA